MDNASDHSDITQLLIAWSDGRREALDDLMPIVYADLRRVAAGYMRRESPGHALQPTALVHEAFVRLVDQRKVKWRNRAHFFGVAAGLMRRILVDNARRGGPRSAAETGSALLWPATRPPLRTLTGKSMSWPCTKHLNDSRPSILNKRGSWSFGTPGA